MVILAESDKYVVRLIPDEVRAAAESDADDRNIPLAFTDTLAALEAGLLSRSSLCAIETCTGDLVGMFSLQHWRLRSLPGHSILRLHQIGESVPGNAGRILVDAAVKFSRSVRGLLAIEAELIERDSAKRQRLSQAFAAAGFEKLSRGRLYTRSLLIDVQKPDEEILSSFRPKARRMLRRAERYAVIAAPIDDKRLVPAIEQLYRKAYTRTGDRPPQKDWARHIDATRQSRERLKLIGAFLNNRRDASDLVAFACIHRNGFHTLYDAAGSARLTDKKIPLMYPVIWEALQWSRSQGAQWFDFGGIGIVLAQRQMTGLQGFLHSSAVSEASSVRLARHGI